MAVHEKKESFKEHNDRGSILLAFYFVLTLLIPNLVLLYTEPYSIWSAEASLFIPMGFYLMWSAVLKRSGIMIWLAFPLVVLAAFQIVLLYLFGNSIIATDMFTNLLTTNPEEAGELLSNIYPSIIIVCAIYLPLLSALPMSLLSLPTRVWTKALSFENSPQEYRPDRTLVLHSRRVVPGPGL